jgi:hypothetical protein
VPLQQPDTVVANFKSEYDIRIMVIRSLALAIDEICGAWGRASEQERIL